MVQRRKKQNQGGEADKNVNNLTGGTEVAEQKRHQIETGQTDQAPVQAADNGENVSNFVNDVHGFLLVKNSFITFLLMIYVRQMFFQRRGRYV